MEIPSYNEFITINSMKNTRFETIVDGSINKNMYNSMYDNCLLDSFIKPIKNIMDNEKDINNVTLNTFIFGVNMIISIMSLINKGICYKMIIQMVICVAGVALCIAYIKYFLKKVIDSKQKRVFEVLRTVYSLISFL